MNTEDGSFQSNSLASIVSASETSSKMASTFYQNGSKTNKQKQKNIFLLKKLNIFV